MKYIRVRVRPLIIVIGFVSSVALLLSPVVPSSLESHAAEKPVTYAGTIYVAGHGGHFAQVDVSIDPTNETDPIKVKALPQDRAKLTVSMLKHENGQSQYKLHDARLDGNSTMRLLPPIVSMPF